MFAKCGGEDVWIWLEEVLEQAAAALLYVITSGKTKLDPRHKMYPIHPPGRARRWEQGEKP